MDDFWKRRKEKQPLEYPSCGSAFKRPAGAYAGALIEQCGLKGHSVGGAQVSEKHAGFIINKDNAKANDIIKLIDYVSDTVSKKPA
jgi:UDP-N-acetylmuramate dehydrogenase